MAVEWVLFTFVLVTMNEEGVRAGTGIIDADAVEGTIPGGDDNCDLDDRLAGVIMLPLGLWEGAGDNAMEVESIRFVGDNDVRIGSRGEVFMTVAVVVFTGAPPFPAFFLPCPPCIGTIIFCNFMRRCWRQYNPDSKSFLQRASAAASFSSSCFIRRFGSTSTSLN